MKKRSARKLPRLAAVNLLGGGKKRKEDADISPASAAATAVEAPMKFLLAILQNSKCQVYVKNKKYLN
jgi:hypothetical protein